MLLLKLVDLICHLLIGLFVLLLHLLLHLGLTEISDASIFKYLDQTLLILLHLSEQCLSIWNHDVKDLG